MYNLSSLALETLSGIGIVARKVTEIFFGFVKEHGLIFDLPVELAREYFEALCPLDKTGV